MNDAKSWFKNRKPYAQLVGNEQDVIMAIQQDLIKIIAVTYAVDAKDYLRQVYVDLIAYSIVLNDYPDFLEMTKKEQKKIIKETQQIALERAKDTTEIIW